MHLEPTTTVLLVLGAITGIVSGFFGIGGGLIVVPALIYFLGFTQHKATGTSLAIMLPPVGLAAVLEYWRHGNVDLRVALFIAAGLFLGGWVGARVADKLSGPQLRLAFGLFVVVVGCWLVWGAIHRLGWLGAKP